MKTTSTGKAAEDAVAVFLESEGFRLLHRNWRRRVCELDIVAEKEDMVYFIEVKYRFGHSQGSGLEYITPGKLKKLKFAASIWCQENGWDGDYRLLAVSVTGQNFAIEETVELE